MEAIHTYIADKGLIVTAKGYERHFVVELHNEAAITMYLYDNKLQISQTPREKDNNYANTNLELHNPNFFNQLDTIINKTKILKTIQNNPKPVTIAATKTPISIYDKITAFTGLYHGLIEEFNEEKYFTLFEYQKEAIAKFVRPAAIVRPAIILEDTNLRHTNKTRINPNTIYLIDPTRIETTNT